MDSNTLSSIDGATALKLDESYEVEEEENNNLSESSNQTYDDNLLRSSETEEETFNNSFSSGVSIENAS